MLRGSLQRKLLAVVLSTTLVAVLFALGAMIGYDLRAYHRGWVDDLNAQAELLGRTTAPALEFDDARVARDPLQLAPQPERRRERDRARHHHAVAVARHLGDLG